MMKLIVTSAMREAFDKRWNVLEKRTEENPNRNVVNTPQVAEVAQSVNPVCNVGKNQESLTAISATTQKY